MLKGKKLFNLILPQHNGAIYRIFMCASIHSQFRAIMKIVLTSGGCSQVRSLFRHSSKKNGFPFQRWRAMKNPFFPPSHSPRSSSRNILTMTKMKRERKYEIFMIFFSCDNELTIFDTFFSVDAHFTERVRVPGFWMTCNKPHAAPHSHLIRHIPE